MKKTTNYLLIIGLSLLSMNCKKKDSTPPDTRINLTGTWDATGYQCTSGVIIPSEEISIIHNLGSGDITATKVTGDDCVTAGNITFSGIYNGSTTSFPATFVTGSVAAPNSSTTNSTIVVTNSKSLTTTFGTETITYAKR